MNAKSRPRRIAADEAHAWARNLRLGDPLAKFVLCMLALYVNAEGKCFVGVRQLAEDCEIDRKTVIRRLAYLEQHAKVITRQTQWLDSNGIRNGDGRGKPTTDLISLLVADVEFYSPENSGPSQVPPNEFSGPSQVPLSGPSVVPQWSLSGPLVVPLEGPAYEPELEEEEDNIRSARAREPSMQDALEIADHCLALLGHDPKQTPIGFCGLAAQILARLKRGLDLDLTYAKCTELRARVPPPGMKYVLAAIDNAHLEDTGHYGKRSRAGSASAANDRFLREALERERQARERGRDSGMRQSPARRLPPTRL